MFLRETDKCSHDLGRKFHTVQKEKKNTRTYVLSQLEKEKKQKMQNKSFFEVRKKYVIGVAFEKNARMKSPWEAAQPPTVGCRMEAQSEHVHIAYTFLHVWHRFVCSVSA